jgi:transposase
MPIVGGLDVHRKQITFDYVDTVTGELRCGQIGQADRQRLRAWLRKSFAGRDDVAFAVEACTGWRYVSEELAGANIAAHLAEPAETAAARGKKRRAKTDRSDARLLRELLDAGRLPECWIPPAHVLECRALLQTYQDLRVEHTAWVQRIHAVCFHHGAEAVGAGGLSTAAGRARLQQIAHRQLSAAGQVQVATAARILDALEIELEALRRRLVEAAKHLRGATLLRQQVYGVGPIGGLAFTCWLGGAGRFSSARKAVRFCGLDVTVYSSAGKRAPGRISRQGPPILRWCAYEAGITHARVSAPDHAYYASVKARIDGKRAALAEARKIIRTVSHILTDLGEDALSWA